MPPITINQGITPLWPLEPSLLLHPNIPGGAAGLNPRSVLGSAWWDATRRSAELMNNHCCYACGIHKSDTLQGWLEGHEMYYIVPYTMRYIRTVSLCSRCHAFIHSGYLLHRLASKQIDSDEYVNTVLHGYRVLVNAEPALLPLTHQVAHMQLACSQLSDTCRSMILDLIAGFSDDLLQDSINFILRQPTLISTPPPTWTLIVGSDVFTHEDLLTADETST